MKSAFYSLSTNCVAGTSQVLNLTFSNISSRITVNKIFFSSLLTDSLSAYKQISRLEYFLAANVTGQLISNIIPNSQNGSTTLGIFGNENTKNVLQGPFVLNPGTSYIFRTIAYGSIALNDVLKTYINIIYE